jgi:ketosteroid isomerase-like protein
MGARETILAFLAAENRRDWDTYVRWLADDVEWTIYGPPVRRIVAGRMAYLATMQRAYAEDPTPFSIVHVIADETTGIVMAELDRGGVRSVDVFEVRDGCIRREREYYDDRVWRAALTAD